MTDKVTCPVCGLDKGPNDFYVRKPRCKGEMLAFQHGCKACRGDYGKRWRQANLERARLINRRAAARYAARQKGKVQA